MYYNRIINQVFLICQESGQFSDEDMLIICATLDLIYKLHNNNIYKSCVFNNFKAELNNITNQHQSVNNH